MPNPNPSPETRFKPGHKLGGRRIGSKRALSEAFLIALEDDFKAHGVETIVQAREKDPVAYMRILAGLLPNDVNLNVSRTDQMTDDELIARMRELAEQIGPALGILGAGGGAEAPAEAQPTGDVQTLQ